jgi:hypothetical protein
VTPHQLLLLLKWVVRPHQRLLLLLLLLRTQVVMVLRC